MTKKISQLPAATSVDTNDEFVINQDGTTKKLTTANEWQFSDVNIDGGNIDGTAIGASSASSGAFTTLTASDDVNFDSGTLFVDASADRVGIGTTSPSNSLQVRTGTNENLAVQSKSGAVGITTYDDAVANNIDLHLQGLQLIFDGVGPTERMRIDSSGRVGIGTTPNAWSTTFTPLQVGGSGAISGSSAQVNFSQNWVSTSTGDTYASTGAATAYTQTTGEHRFFYAGSGTAGNSISFQEAMRIDSSGNVGIGTTAPVTKLQISTSSTASNVFKIANGTQELNLGVNNASGGSYLFETKAQALRFGTSDTERMRIDSSGNVGIGATAPDVLGFGGTWKVLSALGPGNLGGALQLTAGGTGSGTAFGVVAFGGANVTAADKVSASIRCAKTNSTVSDASADLQFFTNSGSSNTERMRIASSGSQVISSSSQGHSSYLTAAAGTTTWAYRAVHSHTAGNFNTGTASMYVWSNGNIVNTNNSYGAISDVKVKENITDATPKLDDINKVRVVNFNLVGQEQKQIGVIAQELEDIFPSIVDENPDLDAEGNDLGTTTKSVKYSVFVPMLIKAVQELTAEVEQLKAQLGA